jgi:general secretion pathway protein H
MVLITVHGTPVSPATHARAAAEAISGALRTARSEAVTSNHSVDVTIDLSSRNYRWGTAPAENLPNDVSVALLTTRDELVSQAVGHIRFNPDGSSSGGRVTVVGGNRIWWVGIDWLSGRVSVAEKPR